MDKIIKIDKNKKQFDELLNKSIQELNSNINKIAIIYESHSNFINFVKTMNIYEKYRWKSLMLEYRQIKNKVNKDKKLIHTVTKFFGTLTNYYQHQEIENIKDQITRISNSIEIMLYKFLLLREHHYQTQLKCKYLIKKPSITIIENYNEQTKPILTKIYENYINIKLLNQQFIKLKNMKRKIEINYFK